MKTAVETVFICKDLRYNCRFLQMCAHLVESRRLHAGLGREKGQIENQVSCA